MWQKAPAEMKDALYQVVNQVIQNGKMPTVGACIYMWTHVDVCDGPYHPLRFGRKGCCFYKSENTESDWYTASPYGLVDLQLPHSSDRGDYIPLSVSVTVEYPPQVVLSCTPTLRTYCLPSTNNKDANSTSLPSVLH